MSPAILKFYRKIFPAYENELDLAVGDSQTLLDVGCGYPSPIKDFSSRLHSVGVDIYEPSIEKSRAEGIHNEYVRADVLEIDQHFEPESYECVLASDLVEHLPKEDGRQFLDKLEALASKRVIVFTPNGFQPQPGHNGNPWQEHKSGWSVEEMEQRGYKVIGINGWQPLRGEFSYLKYQPKFFWQIFSDLTQIITKRRPQSAFQMLCIKDK
jgi:hypothetical protein